MFCGIGRYLFSLQIKRDLAEGQLHCNENTAALMASYIIQGIICSIFFQSNPHYYRKKILNFLICMTAECGDFNAEEYVDHSYVSRFKLVPHQDEEFEWRVMENHKKHMYVIKMKP
jgi:FERM/RhoGEF/pleckstrin domain protein 2